MLLNIKRGSPTMMVSRLMKYWNSWLGGFWIIHWEWTNSTNHFSAAFLNKYSKSASSG